MISFRSLTLTLHGLDEDELTRWIETALVRAQGTPGDWQFEEIDVARIRLILELRHDLDIEERTLPVVLSLLDQLYDFRRRMTRLNEALADVAPEVRRLLLERLS
jgi:chaperone modulatory protein CbpM